MQVHFCLIFPLESQMGMVKRKRFVERFAMPDWDSIFEEKGRVFAEPHQDMEMIAELFHNAEMEKILDIGCGTGRHLIYLAKQGFSMSGFDVSQKAIEMSKQWLMEEGFSANLIQHKMEDVFPYENSFFDAVISVQVIHHNRIRDIRITIAEIERVLRTGGYIFITVPVFPEVPVAPEDDWGLKEVEPGTYLPQRGPESGVLHHYFTEEEILNSFSAFSISKLYIDETGHRCILGTKN